MKKQFLFTIVWLIGFLSLYSQGKTKSVFVMVDLSLNVKGDPSPITKPMREDAIAFSKSIITASYKPNNFPEWEKAGISTDPVINAILNGKGRPLIGEDDFLMIMPFGDISTTNEFQINLIKNYPSDFNKYYQFPFQYDTYNTWGNYAEAKVCNLAYHNKISEYYILRIQGRPDDPNSQLLSKQNQEMIDEYETGAVGEVIARFKYTKASRYTVTIKKVNISKILWPKNYAPPVIDSTNTDFNRKSLRIIAPKGKRKAPFTTHSTTIQLSWSCIGCDSIPKYTVRVNNLETKKNKTHRINNKTITSLRLEPGKYKVTVATKGANSRPQYFTILTKGEDGSFGTFFLAILLLIGGYFAYKHLIQNKKDTAAGSDDWIKEDKKSYTNTNIESSQESDDDW